MLHDLRHRLSATLLIAVVSMLLPAERAFSQNSNSTSELVAAVQPVDDSSSWRVILAEGEARWRKIPALAVDDSWQLVETGIALPPGSELLTGIDGQVRLTRADDNIRVGPDTWLTLEAEAEDLITRIRQTLGTAWYSVRSRVSGRFRVDTARLVAVVKGTEFEIAVGPEAHDLKVREGIVNARSTFGGRDIDVRAGQRVRADASGLKLIVAPDGADGGANDRQRTPDNPANPAPNGGGNGGGGGGGGGQQPGDGREAGNNGSRGNGPQDGNNGNTDKSGNNGKGSDKGDKGRGPDRGSSGKSSGGGRGRARDS